MTEAFERLLDRLTLPVFLVTATTFGFFAMIGLLYFRVVPSDSKEIVFAMLGSVGSAWTGIIGYYFGSSSGSAKKTDIMANGNAPKEETHG